MKRKSASVEEVRGAAEAGAAAAVQAARTAVEVARAEVVTAARGWVEHRTKKKNPGPGSHPSLTAQLTSRVEELEAAETACRRVEESALRHLGDLGEELRRSIDAKEDAANRARLAFTLRELLAIACIREGGSDDDQPKTARRLLGRANRNGLITWRSGTTGIGWYFTDTGRTTIERAGSERLERGRQ